MYKVLKSSSTLYTLGVSPLSDLSYDLFIVIIVKIRLYSTGLVVLWDFLSLVCKFTVCLWIWGQGHCEDWVAYSSGF